MGSRAIFNQDTSGYKFDFEDFIKNELGLRLNKNSKHRNPSEEVCQDFLRGICKRGTSCRYLHSIKKSIVCKHWLRGLCMLEDQCEYLHEYNLQKLPKCVNYVVFGVCLSPNCVFAHGDYNIEICQDFERGLCIKGPKCKKKHVKKAACASFIAGNCPKGVACSEFHPKLELPEEQIVFEIPEQKFGATYAQGQRWSSRSYQFRRHNFDIICFRCGKKGHKAYNCRSLEKSFSRGNEISTK
ncbi:20969_t:CDS:2 [Cetraspora pellucida]|uniref:mRNA 3'-end-processing protein n=1 Tax=Cetraspora pellucida TaxID=1433469 RepID=A0A9N9DE14_9GLOM|nr:20969_t:CDS:2 [Cetraspora pellucida]